MFLCLVQIIVSFVRRIYLLKNLKLLFLNFLCIALFHPKCTPFPIQLFLVRLDQGVSALLREVLRSHKLGNLFIFGVVCSKKFRVVCHDLIWVPVNVLRCFVRSFLVVKHPNCNPFGHNFGVCGSRLVLISSFREDHQGFREVLRVIFFKMFCEL